MYITVKQAAEKWGISDRKVKVTKTSIKQEKNLATKPESLVTNSEEIENKNKNEIW